MKTSKPELAATVTRRAVRCSARWQIHFGGSSKRPARIPGTVISSSNSSQRSAKPFTSTSTCFSCCSVAAAKRRKRSAGNPTKRPSCSSIYIVLASVQTRTAAGSKEIGGSARMEFIICFFSVLVDFRKRGVRSVADHAILRLGCLQEKWKAQARICSLRQASGRGYAEARFPRRYRNENETIRCAERSASINHTTRNMDCMEIFFCRTLSSPTALWNQRVNSG